MCMVKI
jgi:hypothetical protein